jgi:hypothetical protein
MLNAVGIAGATALTLQSRYLVWWWLEIYNPVTKSQLLLHAFITCNKTAGGHSIDSLEPIFGLVAAENIHPQFVTKKAIFLDERCY